MTNQLILLAVVLTPIIGACAIPVINYFSVKLKSFCALGFVLTSFVLAITILPAVYNGQTITANVFGNPLVYADGLAVFMALTSAALSAIIIFYSFGYISHYENQTEYYLMVVLFFGAMMGIVFSANLISLYLFWEITAIASWRLIGFFREKQYVLRADKAFLTTMFGSVLMLLGFICVYQQNGSFDLAVLKNSSISNVAVLLILVGLISKSAMLPLHTWLPDASVAPSPVTALLHAALLVKIGVYVYARLFIADNFVIDNFWHTAVPVIAGVSALVCAGAAIIETDIKRIIAYSTISQIGYIFLGLGIGNEIGVVGAMLYIMMHGITKGGLFLCAGIVEQNTKIKDITKLGGLIKTMPVTAISFLLCSFSVMGIPPFGGFFSKYMVITAAIQNNQPWLSFIFLAGAFMTIIYLLRVFTLVFMGQMKLQSVKEGSAVMLISVAALAILSIAGGILIYYPSHFLHLSAQFLPGICK